jgi:ABC-type antimicrobial peptide transport system permease subunit
MAYTLQQRTREIGIRVALGAQPGNVVRMVMKEVVAIIGIGFAIGLPAAWLSSKLVASLLYGIQPDDPASIGVAMAVLAGIALLAGYIPAARASRVNPLRALRYE